MPRMNAQRNSLQDQLRAMLEAPGPVFSPNEVGLLRKLADADEHGPDAERLWLSECRIRNLLEKYVDQAKRCRFHANHGMWAVEQAQVARKIRTLEVALELCQSLSPKAGSV
ncbi:MAG: hypothetical protein RQ741_02725 [Wenzhouxiangellaceae bacterium]|nr:hypothetical protein [Wenzhouxiangellaceae bacterium]